jgi:aerobic-type carbon monoxide dehydrogenase small subunit (CoxS/CutS family)
MMVIRLSVNGRSQDVSVTPDASLLEVIRAQLGLLGAKQACGRGECGACTVLLDGVPVMACITLAARVRGEVTTIEGLGSEIDDLRLAFAKSGGFQCGFCTSGQIVRAAALLRTGIAAGEGAESHVRHQMSGNICRCTGYTGIVDAILTTAAARRAKSTVSETVPA